MMRSGHPDWHFVVLMWDLVEKLQAQNGNVHIEELALVRVQCSQYASVSRVANQSWLRVPWEALAFCLVGQRTRSQCCRCDNDHTEEVFDRI